jgi:nitrite reductase (NADH) large subunit
MEYSGAFLQLYREEGWYLERTVHYIDRVGLDYVKGKLSSRTPSRKALYERLLFALQDYKDPWLERAQADAKSELGREFRTIAIRQAMQA